MINLLKYEIFPKWVIGSLLITCIGFPITWLVGMEATDSIKSILSGIMYNSTFWCGVAYTYWELITYDD